MNFFNDHRKLFGTALGLFVLLTILVAIMPALSNQKNNAPLPGSVPLEGEALKGKAIYIANGCVGCHTQQVRNVDMDRVWGSRPSIPADYADIGRTDFFRNTATLMGTERTGPDLMNIGARQPSMDWHLVHLYNPRIVVPESVMPAYPWMFERKDSAQEGDVVVNVPENFLGPKGGTIIAKPEALQLVAYLQSLKHVPLPDGLPSPAFLYERKARKLAGEDGVIDLDGGALYAQHCQACHQANGEGLPGAFPPLKGSPIVMDDNPEIFVQIIMQGYNARKEQGYAPMPAVGLNAELTAEEVTAIINHERSSWGNDAKKVEAEEVKKIMEAIKWSNQPS